MAPITIVEFTDPACPWAYCAEPARLRVNRLYGEIEWREPSTIAGAAADAGLDATELERWIGEPETATEFERDMERARHPSAAALALDHKLAGWSGGRRHTCPAYEITGQSGLTLSAPGMREPPESAEVAAVLGVSIEEPRAQLLEVAVEDSVGCDGFWRARAMSTHGAANQ